MNVDPKVIAAISSAVGYYLQAEQEALFMQQQQQRAQAPVAFSSPYAMAGRQSAMDVRWAWQMRMPRR